MTVINDALSNATSYDITGEIDPLSRRIYKDLQRLKDLPYPDADLMKRSEIQTITPGDHILGTFDVDFTLADGSSFSLTTLSVSLTASVLQTNIDAEAAIEIPGYSSGDISVTGGPFGLGGSNTVITFAGESVKGPQPLVEVDGGLLIGGTTEPQVSTTQSGIPENRFWLGIFKMLGLLVGNNPAWGQSPLGQYTVVSKDEVENYLHQETIVKLLKEASIREGQDWEELLPLFGFRTG